MLRTWPFASDNQNILDEFKDYLQHRFSVKLYGKLTSFVGWSIVRTVQGLTIHQNKYSSRLLCQYGCANCNPVSKPIAADFTDYFNDESVILLSFSHVIYRYMIGGISYLAVSIHPGLIFSISLL